MPASLKLALALAPALIVAPPARLTVNVPLPTVSCVVAMLPSTSFTLIRFAPVNVSAVSSPTVLAPPTVFTGASLTAATFTVTVAVSVTPPLVTV